MMNNGATDFACPVSGFLTDYLPLQRNYSGNTILSYRDSLKLFILFLTESKGIQLSDFTMKSFDRQLVTEYLAWLKDRGAGASTVNQRLAALKTFAGYAGIQCLEYLAPLQMVQGIKAKKTAAREITYLSVEQMSALINWPDVNARNGLRHRTLMTLLYDSGCRVQELCDLCIWDIHTGCNPTVRLHGKGNKYRTVTISSNTSKLIREYIDRCRPHSLMDQPLILNREQKKFSRDGVNYVIAKYTKEIHQADPSFPVRIHAHCFRHSKAMHMLAAGINIVYIRDFLGHEDISTTMIYSRADNRLKNEAINKLAPAVTEDTEFPDWTKDQELLAFLNSFK